MKKRWFIYIVIAIIFGIFDFFFHSYISNVLGQGGFLWRMSIYGVWLVPIVPIALFEARISKSIVWSGLASSLTWILSIISYYLFMAVQLAFIGLSTRPELHISSLGVDLYFWENWKSVFWSDVVGSIAEWSGLAVVGGFIVGFSVSFFYLRLEKLIKFRSTINKDI